MSATTRTEENRFRLKRRICPGLWIDMNDDPHWSLTEILEAEGLPDTPENRKEISDMIQGIVRSHNPNAQIQFRSTPNDEGQSNICA